MASRSCDLGSSRKALQIGRGLLAARKRNALGLPGVSSSAMAEAPSGIVASFRRLKQIVGFFGPFRPA
jgi:hypothetical protein